MLTIEVDVNITDAITKLDAINQGEWARKIGDELAEEQILPFFRDYPPQTHAPQPFRSDKSRRFFFAALRRGTITVPYRRSMGIAALWEVTTVNLYTTRIRSTRKNAKYVIGELDEQSPYHAGNWKSVTTVAQFVEDNKARWVAEGVISDEIHALGLD